MAVLAGGGPEGAGRPDGGAGKYTKTRYNTSRMPADAYKLCVVQFKVPGATNGGSDKGLDGNRVDSDSDQRTPRPNRCD